MDKEYEKFLISRSKKKVILRTHFFEKVVSDKLFSSTTKAVPMAIKGIQKKGILIRTTRDDCNGFCFIMSDRGFLVTLPLIETRDRFIVKTAYKSSKWQSKIYKEKKHIKKRRC